MKLTFCIWILTAGLAYSQTPGCPDGYYGKQCKYDCSQGCAPGNGTADCDHVDGTCLNSCKDGYTNKMCNESCRTGSFGKGCGSYCSSNCLLNKHDIPECHHINGTCECQSGYDTTWCNQSCPAGTFGEGCESNCSRYCSLDNNEIPECHHINGTCECQSGYDTPWCNQTCPLGTFGDGCGSICSQFCVTNQLTNVPECHHINGTCECQIGYINPWCNQSCVTGTFGHGCRSNCSRHCMTNKKNIPECHRIDGSCTCQTGYSTPSCNDTCIPGTFGDGCKSTCSQFCVTDKKKIPECHHINGSCECQSGYSPPWCNDTCQPGKYGDGCRSTCSQFCVTNKQDIPECHPINGSCMCQSGYNSPWCNDTCLPGMFGDGCRSACSQFCLLNNKIPDCDHINGSCQCQPGYDTPWCNQSCLAGTFGNECRSACSKFCVLSSKNISECHPINGSCECHSGYVTPWCNQSCPKGKFGDGCKSTCSSFCLLNKKGISECHPIDGTCKCQSGYSTSWCNETCPVGTFDQGCGSVCSEFCLANKSGKPECDHISGACHCQIGYSTPWCNRTCPAGTYGENCSLVCSMFCALNEIGVPVCHYSNGTCECQSGYETSWCNQKKIESSDPPGLIAGAVIGGVAAAAVLGAIGVIFVWHRRKIKLNQLKGSSKSEDANSGTSDNSKQVSGTELTELKSQGQRWKEPRIKKQDIAAPVDSNSAVYYNYLPALSSTTIPRDDLSTFLATHKRSFFQEEFSTIQINNEATMDVGLAFENRSRNRYRNIIPYDHSRVHLKNSDKHNTDGYINASYIQGYNGINTFISTQGPTQTTLDDFVCMLWEQNVKKIVMLANVIEQGKEKCAKYWPENGVMKAGMITVTVKSTQVFADFTIRKLVLKKPGKTDHHVTHFHFTAWPDLDVPLAPWGLVDFEQRVSSYPTTKPIVVHCSAGVGRTGTFIALLNVMRQAEDKGHLDFFTTVQKLRRDRVNMVQTSKQYEFLHEVTQVALLCKGTSVNSNDVQDRMNCLEKTSESGATCLEQEFTTICTDLHDDQSKEDEPAEASLTFYEHNSNIINKHKNRLSNITANMLYAPVLQCETDYLGDYINAVFVPSFRKQNQHFLTQLPLPTTVIDFWRLVTQYKVSLIVSFEDDLKATDPTVGEYLPPCDRQAVIYSMFEIESDIVFTSKLWQQRKITVTIETEYKNAKLSTSAALKEEHILTHLKCMTTDLDTDNLLALVAQIRLLNSGSEQRTVYLCRNGADYSGLVYVLSLLLDRMDNDGCSTVPLAVGAIKAVRPQVIPTLAQYRLLYQVLNLYSKSMTSTPL